MGRKTGRDPQPGDTPLWRICHALDEVPRVLAANIGVPYRQLEPLLEAREIVADIERDEIWLAISEYADRRFGQLMAIRAELARALHTSKSRRALRAERQKRPPPRSLR